MLWLRPVVVSTFGLVATWLVATKSLPAYLAQAAPDAALRIDPTHPRASSELAERAMLVKARRMIEEQKAAGHQGQGAAAQAQFARFNFARQTAAAGGPVGEEQSAAAGPQAGSQSAANASAAQIRTWAEQALQRNPLDARSLRTLALLAEDEGDAVKAERAMRAAARVSLREAQAVYWLMRRSVELQDADAALYYADALSRSYPRQLPLTLPVFAALAEHRRGNAVMKAALAENPPWRLPLLTQLTGLARDARTPLDLMLALRDSRHPPTNAELRAYVEALVERGRYDVAYYTYLQFLPPERLSSTGFLSNGSFDLEPSGLPFDWHWRTGSGATVEIVPEGAPGRRALYVAFGVGRVEFYGVTQLMMLGPGDYRLKGRYKGELKGRRGLRWRVVCAETRAKILGEGPMLLGNAPAWKDVEVAFQVPASDCRAQYVRLELDSRSASEQLVSGEMWFDNMAVSRIP